jgi:hypothetical protein
MIQRLNAEQTRQMIRDLVPLGIANYRIPEQVTGEALENSCVPVAASSCGRSYGLFSDDLMPRGVIVGLVVPEPMTGVKVGIEQLWWSADNGLPLLRRFEADCKSEGCARVILGFSPHVNAKRMRRIYEGIGYSDYSISVSKGL